MSIRVAWVAFYSGDMGNFWLRMDSRSVQADTSRHQGIPSRTPQSATQLRSVIWRPPTRWGRRHRDRGNGRNLVALDFSCSPPTPGPQSSATFPRPQLSNGRGAVQGPNNGSYADR